MSRQTYSNEPLWIERQGPVKPVPFTLWSAPEGGRMIGRSATGHIQDVEWIEEPGSHALWIDPDE